MQHITDMIKETPNIQSKIAQLYGIIQSRPNNLLRGKISKFSLDALVNINAHLGVKISLDLA